MARYLPFDRMGFVTLPSNFFTMRTILSFFLFFLLLLSTHVSFAQPGQRFSTDNKKAISLFQDAVKNYELGLKEEAAQYLEKALDKEPQFAEAYLLRAQLKADKELYRESIEDLQRGAAIGGRDYADAVYFAGELQMRLGEYMEALKSFERFLGAKYNDEQLNRKGQLMLESCTFAQWSLKNPVDFNPINLGPAINSEFSEYYPCITADGKTFLYTRRVADGRVRGGEQEDFFVSARSEEGWNESVPLSAVNTVFNEGAPTLSADGQLLIYTACEAQGGNWGPYDGLGSCDLFVSRKIGEEWGKGMNIKGVNSYVWDSQPSFSADGRTLYFVRGKTGYDGVKGQDIYYASILSDGTWTKPAKVPGDINTEFEEESVMIHPDGETMYFSSNGHPGMGGLDIFVSKKRSDGSWGKPTNLGYPINTGGNDNSLLVEANGKVAFFASDREGGMGGLDLYQFELPMEVRPKPVSYVSGKVFDGYTYAPLSSKLELIDLATGELVVESYSDEVNGAFLVCLPPDRDYALNVSRPGYLFYSMNFSLKNIQATDLVELEAPLKKLRPGNKVVLNNVFFDTDSYALRPESKIELNKLVKQLQVNSNIRVEIGGHTDNVGGKDENKTLSERRAQAVVDYIVSVGIPADRLVAKGYGEDEPVMSNETEAGKAKNRRTEMKIVE